MTIQRRDFLRWSGIGAAGLLSACTRQSSPASGNTSSGTGASLAPATFPLDVRINFIGGFALVMDPTDSWLNVGSVRALHHPMHGMELRLITGDVIDKTTSIPTNKGSAKYKQRWILDGLAGAVIGGIPATGINYEDVGKEYETLPVPAADKWNDVQYLHQPLKYHEGAKLKDRLKADGKTRETWKDDLHARLRFGGGTLEVLKPDFACFEKGLWYGYDTSSTKKFEKPIATTSVLKATISEPLVLDFNGETLTFVGDGSTLTLQVIASSQLPYMKFKKGEKQGHAGMFYQLITDRNDRDITDHILPSYWSFDGGDECNQTTSPIPGEGCSPCMYA